MRVTKAQRTVSRQHLATLELFAPCTSRQLDGIARLGTGVNVGEGTRLCMEHRTPPQFVIVLDGQIALFHGEDEVGLVQSGGWFGHVALMANRAVEDLTAIVYGSARLLVFSRREFATLLDAAPEMRKSLVRADTLRIPGRVSALVGAVTHFHDAQRLVHESDTQSHVLAERADQWHHTHGRRHDRIAERLQAHESTSSQRQAHPAKLCENEQDSGAIRHASAGRADLIGELPTLIS